MAGRSPKLSYIIWFSQRVGSTLLTQALEDTGVAGRPREWLETWNTPGLLAKHGVESASELREVLWQKGTTTNGVLGVKYGTTDDLHREVTRLFSDLIPGEPDPDGRRAWEACNALGRVEDAIMVASVRFTDLPLADRR